MWNCNIDVSQFRFVFRYMKSVITSKSEVLFCLEKFTKHVISINFPVSSLVGALQTFSTRCHHNSFLHWPQSRILKTLLLDHPHAFGSNVIRILILSFDLPVDIINVSTSACKAQCMEYNVLYLPALVHTSVLSLSGCASILRYLCRVCEIFEIWPASLVERAAIDTALVWLESKLSTSIFKYLQGF